MGEEETMFRRAVLLAATWAALWPAPSPPAGAPADKAGREEFARLEGAWEYLRPAGSTEEPLRLVFKGGKLTVVWVGMGSLPAEVKLYPGTDPKCIDIEFKKVRREHYEGIYKVEGDTLRLALAPSDVKERPTELPDKAEPGKGQIYGVFKRVKP
jgi:uncharacterized protein (TIGR03067 family)